MSWITRFMPGVGPAIGAFLNPWVLLALLAALVGAYLFGLREGHQQLEQYQAAVAAVGKAKEAVTRATIARQQDITKGVRNEAKERIRSLNRNHADQLERLRTDTSRSVLPTVPDAAAGDPNPGQVCFKRDELNRRVGAALVKLLEGAAGVLQRGDRRAIDFLSCATWVLEQKAAGDALRQPPP